jgi:hypothetical protein
LQDWVVVAQLTKETRKTINKIITGISADGILVLIWHSCSY